MTSCLIEGRVVSRITYGRPTAGGSMARRKRETGPQDMRPDLREDSMAARASNSLYTSRRKFLAGTAAVAGASAFPMPSIAQAAPIKIGVLTVKTGPLAAGGIHCEEGITTFLKEKSYTLAGRKI